MAKRTIFPFFFLFCTACAALVPAPQRFETVQSDYAGRLRWRDFSAAARYMQPDLGEEFRRRFAELPDLNVTDVRLESAEYTDGGRRVDTWNSIEYFLLPSATVKVFRFEQGWELVGGDRWNAGIWRIVTPFPPFPDKEAPSRLPKPLP